MVEEYYVIEMYVEDLPVVFNVGFRAGTPPVPGHENVVDSLKLDTATFERLEE